MTDLSVGSGILASVIFIVFIGLTIFSILLWKDVVEGTGVLFSTAAYTGLTVAVGGFLAFFLGLI